MRIIELRASNIKRLVAVEIRPDGALVQITGRNGAGKTSVLDAIWWALAGTRDIQAQPIRKGCESAVIRLDLGEIRVTRTFKAKEEGGATTTLKVEDANGKVFNSPQSVLDAIVGELSFDPLAFTRMGPKEQFAMCRAFVPGVDFDALEQANKKDFDERTEINRRAKDFRARADAIRLPSGPVPEMVDVGDLQDQLKAAGDHNTALATKKANREAARGRIAAIDDQIAALQAEKTGIEERLAEAGPLGEAIDTEALRAKLDEALQGNDVARQAAQRRELEGLAKAAEGGADALTTAMKERTEAAAKAVAAAKMPVPGLGFGEGCVMLNGQPFDQASDAEQLRASIAIAGALNPKLRVIRVRDGSLIDDDGMKALAAYAEANDLQVWIEKVDSSGRVGFVLEDGHLAGAAPDPNPERDEEAI